MSPHRLTRVHPVGELTAFALAVYGDGKTEQVVPLPYAQWLAHDGRYFYGELARDGKRDCMVYLEVSKDEYDAHTRVL